MEELNVVGKPLGRVDGVARATGRITYGVDVKLAGMLHGKILRSEYPHARIRRIDYGPALRLPGVKAVVTGADRPAIDHQRGPVQPSHGHDRAGHVLVASRHGHQSIVIVGGYVVLD